MLKPIIAKIREREMPMLVAIDRGRIEG